jgi:hypothetical protein
MNKEDKEVIKNIISQLNKLVKNDEKKIEVKNDEDELLKDLYNINKDLIGKIYRIQSYVTLVIEPDHEPYISDINEFVPHMVIGINHDGTENTMDLMQMVTPNYFRFIIDPSCIRGDYFLSNIYEYVKDKHINGYSENIRLKMKIIEEKFRRPVEKYTRELKIRTTNCKILNPVELYGSRALDVFSTKYSDLDDRYGEIYEAFIKDPKNRLCYGDIDISVPIYHWTNSFAFYTNQGDPRCFTAGKDGSCYYCSNVYAYGIAPVIRLGK